MKILLIMDPYIPIPPPAYGGHERLVAMFAEEYEKLGHQVTLLAGPGSIWPRIHIFGQPNTDLNTGPFQRTIEMIQVWYYLIKNARKFDLIHNFGRLLYLFPTLSYQVKKIMTYGRDVTGSAIKKINLLPNRNLVFTACSNYCASTGNTAGRWETVYNAIDFSKYTLRDKVPDEAPLIFLGRIEEIKGPHTAVQLALKTGNKLWIAGNITKEHETFFNEKIRPFVDGRQISYLGPLNDEQKNRYLGEAKALLFPIEWDEPFGMVMVEAMACGTPVIAIKRGSVDEVVDEGITGFKVNDFIGMADKLSGISHINRQQCRKHAKKRFNVPIIAQKYLSLFK